MSFTNVEFLTGISPYVEIDKVDGNILMKMTGLAPIEVEILLWRGSPQKIETDSGISSLSLL
jgi:hypothetical protein